jgi:hypothetical protein
MKKNRKMKKTLLIISCLISLNMLAKSPDIYRSIYQFSYSHGEMGTDSIVLIRYPESEFYNKLLIYRDKKLKYESNDSTLQIEGVPYGLFVEQEIVFSKSYYYIFKLFNAPDPSKFLILYITKESITQFGITKPSTAEIFGDIDSDGKFEIGGFESYCEADDKACSSKNLYSVFKIDKGFPIDKKLTKYFKQFLK